MLTRNVLNAHAPGRGTSGAKAPIESGRSTAALKRCPPKIESGRSIAALKRCATQNQVRHRVFFEVCR